MHRHPPPASRHPPRATATASHSHIQSRPNRQVLPADTPAADAAAGVSDTCPTASAYTTDAETVDEEEDPLAAAAASAASSAAAAPSEGRGRGSSCEEARPFQPPRSGPLSAVDDWA